MNVPPPSSGTQPTTSNTTESGNTIYISSALESSFWSCLPKSDPFDFVGQASVEPILSSISFPKKEGASSNLPQKSMITYIKPRDPEKLNKKPKDKVYKCDLCEYSSRFQNGLDYHMRKQHGKGEQFVCPDCGYVCFLKQNLHQHMRQHTGEKPFACEFCDFASASKSGLRYHIRTKHDKHSLISCTVCNYRAYNTHILSQHLRKHSGQRPFTCVLCNATFAVKPSWKYHMKTKHNITNLTSPRSKSQPSSCEDLASTSRKFQESRSFRADEFSPS